MSIDRLLGTIGLLVTSVRQLFFQASDEKSLKIKMTEYSRKTQIKKNVAINTTNLSTLDYILRLNNYRNTTLHLGVNHVGDYRYDKIQRDHGHKHMCSSQGVNNEQGNNVTSSPDINTNCFKVIHKSELSCIRSKKISSKLNNQDASTKLDILGQLEVLGIYDLTRKL